jgi:hypothetical protein
MSKAFYSAKSSAIEFLKACCEKPEPCTYLMTYIGEKLSSEAPTNLILKEALLYSLGSLRS